MLVIEHAVVLVVAAGRLFSDRNAADAHIGAGQLCVHLFDEPLRGTPVPHALPQRVVPPLGADGVGGVVERAVRCEVERGAGKQRGYGRRWHTVNMSETKCNEPGIISKRRLCIESVFTYNAVVYLVLPLRVKL